MSDPQSWAIVGVFATATLGGLTLVVTMMSRVIRALDRDVRAVTDKLWRGDRDA